MYACCVCACARVRTWCELRESRSDGERSQCHNVTPRNITLNFYDRKSLYKSSISCITWRLRRDTCCFCCYTYNELREWIVRISYKDCNMISVAIGEKSMERSSCTSIHIDLFAFPFFDTSLIIHSLRTFSFRSWGLRISWAPEIDASGCLVSEEVGSSHL